MRWVWMNHNSVHVFLQVCRIKWWVTNIDLLSSHHCSFHASMIYATCSMCWKSRPCRNRSGSLNVYCCLMLNILRARSTLSVPNVINCPLNQWTISTKIVRNMTSIRRCQSMRSVLKTQKQPSNVLMDITDGYQSRQIMRNEGGRFFTLCMNVDTVQVSESSDQSLLIITLVVNIRSEPNRAQMQTMRRVIVHQLKPLENSITIQFSDSDETLVPVYLICAWRDKPAQSLVQNTAEPTGGYGCCGRCLIKGNQNSPNCYL